MLRLMLFVGLSLVLFQNCGTDVGFSQSGSELVNASGGPTDPPGGGGPVDPEIINETCDNTPQQQTVVAVNFPRPNQTCDWNANGNLSPLNSFFRARIEQKRSLNLPAGAVICDAEFDFAQQDFLYDDHFLLMFNSSVIAASYDFTPQLDSGTYGLLQYDWEKLAGMDWDTDQEEIFCPQIPGFGSSCSFPGHDQQGLINLSYDSAYIRGVMANGVPQNHSFTMVSIGDNDVMDCEHSDVAFDVTVRYVMPQ